MDLFAWADLEMQVIDCNKCHLCETRKNAVFGTGPDNAEILIIAEAPGKEEDIQGIPFVGKSGQLLRKILEACNFNNEQHVFFANIVKCHPNGNREPSPEERDACMPYLMKQIEMLNPKIIVLLGRVALQSMIDPKASIMKMRGTWIEWNGHQVMPTYHPAALLRNPEYKKDSWEDFKKVFFKYRELVDPDHTSPNIPLSKD